MPYLVGTCETTIRWTVPCNKLSQSISHQLASIKGTELIQRDYRRKTCETTSNTDSAVIPQSSTEVRRCAEEDLLLHVGRWFPRAMMPSSTEAVALDVSASNCRCRTLSKELRTLAACSGKCSANAPNALHSYNMHAIGCILDYINSIKILLL